MMSDEIRGGRAFRIEVYSELEVAEGAATPAAGWTDVLGDKCLSVSAGPHSHAKLTNGVARRGRAHKLTLRGGLDAF